MFLHVVCTCFVFSSVSCGLLIMYTYIFSDSCVPKCNLFLPLFSKEIHLTLCERQYKTLHLCPHYTLLRHPPFPPFLLSLSTSSPWVGRCRHSTHSHTRTKPFNRRQACEVSPRLNPLISTPSLLMCGGYRAVSAGAARQNDPRHSRIESAGLLRTRPRNYHCEARWT